MRGKKAFIISFGVFCIFFMAFLTPVSASILVYGPNVSHIILKTLSKVFAQKIGTSVSIIAGPEELLRNIVPGKADIIYDIKDFFVGRRVYESNFSNLCFNKKVEAVEDLVVYMDAILAVKHQNPLKIRGFSTLIKNCIPVLASRDDGYSYKGRVAKNFFSNLTIHEKEKFASVLDFFEGDSSNFPVLMTWRDRLINRPDLGESVSIEPFYRLTRQLRVSVVKNLDKDVLKFMKFLKSEEARKIFLSHGWYLGKIVERTLS